MPNTLTFSGSFSDSFQSIKVNGNTITSPYTLQDGDVIIAEVAYSEYYDSERDRTFYYSGVIKCNNIEYDGVTETLNIDNENIVLVASSGSTAYSSSSDVNDAVLTINYSGGGYYERY